MCIIITDRIKTIVEFLQENGIVKEECLIAPSGKRASCDIPVLNSETKEKINICTLFFDDQGGLVPRVELWCRR